MKHAVFAILAATLLLAGCEQSKVDSGAASGSGQGVGYGSDGRGGVGQQDLGAGGRHGVGTGTLDGSVPDRVFFGTDQHTLDAEARAVLDRQAGWLQRYNQALITIEGHADERGTREYNLALAERRAAAARDYLAARGIAPSRIRVISYGKERPAVVGFNESAWAQNRRAVTLVQ